MRPPAMTLPPVRIPPLRPVSDTVATIRPRPVRDKRAVLFELLHMGVMR